MFRFVRSVITDFADLLFPTLCLSCNQPLGDNERILCTDCRINLPETGQHQESNSQVLNKFAGKVPIQFAASYLYYTKGGTVQKLIHHIKYKGKKEAAKEIANWYGYQLKDKSNWLNVADLIVGVPLHKNRQRQRGYNQADWIAEGLSESLEIPFRTDVLIRTKFLSSQTRKNRIERWENVSSVFAVQNTDVVKDKHVVVVDDVLTTGATVEACAAELLKAGCKSVGILTIAATHR
ncbi:phosphoribosyltransferase [Fibrisoma limi BUZ 3]|uniref:Phosphoribosyltransferase n=1 Tax=Fibrisoma limi BUZ 3 TaxID=1185876 RepID=I2GRS9_9BACT|nr:phosphoribosyltransferase family protein [Fibrisoma limi]CCH56607.1 phosphoribosyltransferase [Fibrisoma limi BUZ 3]